MFLNNFLNGKPAFLSMSMPEAEKELAKDKSVYLIDVRSKEEYRDGHIPGSLHLPLDLISNIGRLVPEKDARLFVYCLSGGRSRLACTQLARLGYSDVTNIGGIMQWKGKIERKMGA